jgi:integrase
MEIETMAASPTPSQKITKSYVDKLSTPETGQAFIRDAELKGFAVRVTSSGSKSFILEKRIDGKVKRLTLGRYPELTVEQARKEAHKLLGQIAMGRNPPAEKKSESLQGITLQQAFEDFIAVRKQLKARTLYDYQRIMKTVLVDWQNKAMLKISKDMVAKRHSKIGAEHGKAHANLAMRFLRALYNFAIAQYEDGNGNSVLRENPVIRLTQTRAWYRVERRQTVIKPHELEPWFNAIMHLKNDAISQNRETIRDYLLLVLLTGLRREESASMTWNNIDLKAKTLKVIDTKNHLDHTLPLSDFLYDLLQQRKNTAINEYVFQRANGAGYISEQRKQIAKVIKGSGVSFTIHDLRRTFLTIAESLDIPAYAVKRLANHKMSNDVTAGYIVADVERLRQPMQKITDYILKCAGYKPSATVTNLAVKNLQNNS